MSSSRVHRSLMNAKVNLIFYFLPFIFSFISRKVFLDSLGADFIGLTGTLGNILGYLNLAELGIGSCISYFLFKPIQEGNREKIQEIVSVFGYMYKRIGTVIAIAAMAVSLCFPLIFKNEAISLGVIYFAFYSFLSSSLIGYFINYRQILLSADQKNYIVSIYFQSANLVKTGVQIAVAYYYGNPYVWAAIELAFNILGCIVLNHKINKEYPWLKTDKAKGKILMKQYPEIIKNTKQIFVHKIKDFILTQSDEILIFSFVDLTTVAFYNNYKMIIRKLGAIFSAALDGMGAGVGNLVAEGNKANIMKVFWELMAIRYFIGAFLCFNLYMLIEPFITIWLGADYLLPRIILVLVMIDLYIHSTRGVVDMYNHAYGQYADVWSAWVELVINLSVTIGIGIIGGKEYGLIGIMLGKICSMVPIVIFWKPYYLFSDGLHLPYIKYWLGVLRFYGVTIVTVVATYTIATSLPFSPYENVMNWIIYSAITVTSMCVIQVSLMILFTPGTRDFMHRLPFVKKFVK